MLNMLELRIRREYVMTSLAYFLATILLCTALHINLDRRGDQTNSVLPKDSYDDTPNTLGRGKSTAKSYTHLWKYYLKREKPWLLLPDSAMCYQEPCESNTDCCRRYNICDRSAYICIDCWYGYPCRSSRDCCERYPRCSKAPGDAHGRCHSGY